MSDRKPIVLIVSAQTTPPLDNLYREAEEIRTALRDSTYCEPLVMNAATLKAVCDELDRKENRDRITVFHYAGHANGEGVMLEDSIAYVHGLAKILKQQRNLQLVFLNGCATEGQAKDILEAGIPATLVTSKGIDDQVALNFANAFYRSLAQDKDIRVAFEFAEASIEAAKGHGFRGAYSQTFQADGEIKAHWPWRIFGSDEAKGWRLRDSGWSEVTGRWKPENFPLNTVSPYLGIRRFEETDKERFFGRDAFIEELLDASEKSSLLLVCGASGSGKSSVVRAGMIPKWRQARGDKAKVIVLTPDADPFLSFFSALCTCGYSQNDAAMAQTASPATIRQASEALRKEGESWLIVVDQFEECFTRIPDREAQVREDFVASLVDVQGLDDPGLRIILTMRHDFFPSLGEHTALSRITDNHLHRLTPMDNGAIREVIERPAAEHGVGFETGLVERLIDEIKGRPGNLPLLQYTLNALWAKDDVTDRLLNTDSYDVIGGVSGALRQRMDKFYEDDLDDYGRLALQRVLLRLVDIGQTAAGAQAVSKRTRIDVFTREEDTEILRRSIEEKLLVSCGDEAQPSVELSHEALITAWPQFGHWVEEGQEAIAIRNRLHEDAERWKEFGATDPGKSDEELWRGSRLERVLGMERDQVFDLQVGGLSQVEKDFIEAGCSLRERQAKIERKRLLVTLGIVSMLAVIALVLAAVAFSQKAKAVKEKKRAERSLLMISDAHEEATGMTGSLLALLINGQSEAQAKTDWDAAIKTAEQNVAAFLNDSGQFTDEPEHTDSVSLNKKGRFYLETAKRLGRNKSKRQKYFEIAEQSFQDALALRKTLWKDDPSRGLYVHDLAVSYENLGDLNFERFNRASIEGVDRENLAKAALENYEAALRESKKLENNDIRNPPPNWQHDIAGSYFKLGVFYQAITEFETALRNFRLGLKHAEVALESNEKYSKWEAELARFHLSIGETHMTMGDPIVENERIAKEHLTKGKAILEKLDEQVGLTEDWKEWLDDIKFFLQEERS